MSIRASYVALQVTRPPFYAVIYEDTAPHQLDVTFQSLQKCPGILVRPPAPNPLGGAFIPCLLKPNFPVLEAVANLKAVVRPLLPVTAFKLQLTVFVCAKGNPSHFASQPSFQWLTGFEPDDEAAFGHTAANRIEQIDAMSHFVPLTERSLLTYATEVRAVLRKMDIYVEDVVGGISTCCD
jgi:hypothetical protein